MQMQPASSPAMPETPLAVLRPGGEKPHQGFLSRNPALYQGPTVCNSTTALGLRGQAKLNRVGSRCTGKERDTESGNDYFFARYYSSAMGRFLSPDWAAKAEPVPYAKLDDPQTLNLYGYLRNNPLGGVDADGHCGGGPNDPPCSEVKVEAKVTQQPKIEKNTPVMNSDGKVIAHGTGPTGGQLTDTVTVNGKPAEGVGVAEKNVIKNTENGQAIPGSLNENRSAVPTDSNGQIVDNITMQQHAAGTAQGNNAIVNDMSTNVYTSTDKQTLTLTFPSGGTCTATSTRVMTNAGADGQPSSTYTLRTTQPVVRDPSN
jgi:RHS repeat-associated protein